MKKKVFVLALLFLLLCGCTREARGEETIRELTVVGFSQVGSESDWRVANTESIRETFCEENGFELIFDDAKQKQENQIAAIRTFIQQKVDYIVLSPITESGWDSVLEEAYDAGIPVIIVDRRIHVDDESLYVSRVGSDFRAEADTAMRWLEHELILRGADKRAQRILHLQGTAGSTAQLLRTEGLEQAVAQNPLWSIAAQLQGAFTEAKAYESTAEFLKTDCEIDVIYCENDNMAFGAMRALDDAGISYGVDGDVIIISFDAVRAALDECLAGNINLCVECNPLHGPRVATIIAQMEAGQVAEKELLVEETYFTQKNLTQELIDSRTY